MNKSINRLINILRLELLSFFLLVAIIAILGYSNIIPNGIYASKEYVNISYILNTIVVIISFIAIWSGLKLFKLNTEKNIHRLNFDSALSTFHLWSIFRLIIFFVAISFDLCIYIFTLEDVGLLFTVILILLIMIFCIPSKNVVEKFLNCVKNDN